MNNRSKIIFLIFMGLFISFPVLAGPKFDIAATAGKITTQVSDKVEAAKKTMDESVTIQTMIAYGKAAKEGMDNLKDIKKMAEEQVNTVTGAVSTVSSVASEVQSSVSEVKGMASDVSSSTSSVPSATSGLKEISNIKSEIAEIEAQKEDDISTAQEEINAKIEALQTNNGKLSEMSSQNVDKKAEYEAQIASNNKEISSYKNQLTEVEVSINSQYESQLLTKQEELQSAQLAAAESTALMAGQAFDKLKGLMDNSEAQMQSNINKNFISKNDNMSSEKRAEIKTNRRQDYAQNLLSILNESIILKQQLTSSDSLSDIIKEKADESEGASTSTVMDIKLKIENMKALLIYAKLMAYDMQMQTSRDLSMLKELRLNNPDKDISEFNLDDYKYSKNECDGVKKGDLSGLANAKISDLKSAASSVVSEGNSLLSDAKSATNNFNETITEDK